MCGFVGVFNSVGRRVDAASCRKATDLLAHRGPDASGEWLSETGDVFLAHRRLSIIDLSDNAAQPMIGRNGDVLIYNGEIYNFQDLRGELESAGYRFKSTCDTEVLLYALEAWGPDCLNKLEGMFTFALWRPATEEVLLARDPFGIKPLYYWRPPQGGLVVASEIKSFYAFDEFKPEIAIERLPEYVRFRCISSDGALLRGVKKVMPGQWLSYSRRSDELKVHTYWEPFRFITEESSQPESPPDENRFLETFKAVVKRHLIADVPVGAQFSGGIDSSLIAAICVKDLGAHMKGFYCRVQGAAFDETPYAEAIAGFIGMELNKAGLDGADFLSERMEELTRYHDEPLMHPNSVGIHLISRIAYGDVKVLLSGECADELFGGYSHYVLLRLGALLKDRPTAARCLESAGAAAGAWAWPAETLRRLAKRSRKLTEEEAIVTAVETADETLLTALLADPRAGEKSTADRLTLLPANADMDVVTKSQLFDVKTYIPMLLMRQDKMSMAASIENRVPFAVPEILRLAMRVPLTERVSLFRRKTFLKSCLERYLPKKYVHRRKWGFGLPLPVWLRSPEGRRRLEEMTANDSPLNDIMDRNVIRKIAADFTSGSTGNANILWTLLSLQVWMKIFLRSW